MLKCEDRFLFLIMLISEQLFRLDSKKFSDRFGLFDHTHSVNLEEQKSYFICLF